jgi:hypothetical protein
MTPTSGRQSGTTALAALLVGAALVTTAGCNDCDFHERCEGDVLLVCGEGVDQQVGRKVRRFACAKPNPTCVPEGAHAFCATSATPRCDLSDPDRCDGEVFTTCHRGDVQAGTPANLGYAVALDCATLTSSPNPDALQTSFTCRAPPASPSGCVPN